MDALQFMNEVLTDLQNLERQTQAIEEKTHPYLEFQSVGRYLFTIRRDLKATILTVEALIERPGTPDYLQNGRAAVVKWLRPGSHL